MRNSRLVWAGLAAVALLLLLLLAYCGFRPSPSPLQQAAAPSALQAGRILGLNDAVVTGFSGTVLVLEEFAHPSTAQAVIDQTFIDVNGPAARIINAREPRFVWNGSYWAAPRTHDVAAARVGQVFGIAIDDRATPDIYLAATSAYGLNLVTPPEGDDPDDDDLPRRQRIGNPRAQWMAGQFGPGGGPTSIWRIDGRTGAVTLFATIALDGVAGGPAALGNLAYDPGHHQLFVSDLSTGMIHRLDLGGRDLGHFDHGVDGRGAADLTAVRFESGTRASIASERFDSENPATWGFAPAERRVWGLAVHDGRLYYAVADGQIWSVGLKDDGDFAADPRKEIDVPGGANAPPVSDIVFSHDGAMIVAQRAVIGTHYNYSPLKPLGVAHVYRFWHERPDDAKTPSAWYQQPEEYAVGFAGGNHASGGGVDLGYGYKSDGTFDFSGCEEAIFFTGDALRDFHQTKDGFEAGGPLKLNGLQISPSRPARGFNAPPAISYFVNYGTKIDSADHRGTMGGVRVYRLDCAERACRPARDRDFAVVTVPPGGGGGGGGGGTTTDPPNNPPDDPHDGCIGADCGGCTGPDCSPCVGPDCTACEGPGCTEPKVCMAVEGQAVCDPATGGWVFKLTTADPLGLGIDTLNAYSRVPGVTVSNGPQISLVPPPGIIRLGGATPGQTVTVDVCGFNSADPNYQTGKPYDCCRETLRVRVPRGVCKPGDGQVQ
ncbi:MAG TPA: hypothetical protein VGC36_00690 [Rhizomicrobium sp.]